MSDLEDMGQSPPVWAIFGDLMAGMVGALALVMVWFLSYQMELHTALLDEVEQRGIAEQQHSAEVQRRHTAEQLLVAEEQRRVSEEKRRVALELALQDPLATGRVTLNNGRIGISGSVLFALNSHELQTEGEQLLTQLVGPLKVYLQGRDELLMISGFTDDLAIQEGNHQYADNWELSAQRALTVTRALIDQGLPPELVFTAAFGSESPAVPNQDEQSRAQNRRVEIAPVPRSQPGT